jgi:hypothetical protein
VVKIEPNPHVPKIENDARQFAEDTTGEDTRAALTPFLPVLLRVYKRGHDYLTLGPTKPGREWSRVFWVPASVYFDAPERYTTKEYVTIGAILNERHAAEGAAFHKVHRPTSRLF